MFSTAVLMAAIVIVAKALGLLRDILVANAYGMQSAAQAYEIASRLPIMIFDFVIGGVVSAAFIPIFSELLVKRSEKDAMRFANSYVNLIFVLTATMALFGILFSDSLVRFLAPEASSEVLSLASYLSKIMFPMIVFTGLAFSFVGILQSLGEFRIPALISLYRIQ
ncbi:MAG: lipid II flippase MurJ [Lachnospiraceae bacterium]